MIEDALTVDELYESLTRIREAGGGRLPVIVGRAVHPEIGLRANPLIMHGKVSYQRGTSAYLLTGSPDVAEWMVTKRPIL